VHHALWVPRITDHLGLAIVARCGVTHNSVASGFFFWFSLFFLGLKKARLRKIVSSVGQSLLTDLRGISLRRSSPMLRDVEVALFLAAGFWTGFSLFCHLFPQEIV